MYERDGETNALVPVITLAGALQEGDRVTVNAGRLYKTDPLTNALIPVVHAAGDSDSGFMVPDYANMETVNRITANNGTWTVDRNGFVRAGVNHSGTNSGQTWASPVVYINNILVGAAYCLDTGNISGYTGIFPVRKGDIVKLSTNTAGGTTNFFCNYIPPAFIKKELPVIVEKNGSYSLDEVKTADTWINGKPIYKRTYTVNNPTVWDEGVVDSGVVAPPHIEVITDSVYMVKSTTTSHYNTNILFPVREWRVGVMPNGNFGGWFVTGYGGMAANTGVMTVWYTKTTD
jgi:hypothetical protein